MKEIRHMSMSIAGALRNYGKKSMKGLITDDDGTEWSDSKVRNYLYKCLDEGKRLLPCSDCEGFDYQKGCPGHPVKDEVSEVDTDCMGQCYSDTDSGL